MLFIDDKNPKDNVFEYDDKTVSLKKNIKQNELISRKENFKILGEVLKNLRRRSKVADKIHVLSRFFLCF